MSSAGTAPTIKTLMKASGNEKAVDAEQDHTETELYPLSVKFFENPSHEHWTMVQLMRKILQQQCHRWLTCRLTPMLPLCKISHSYTSRVVTLLLSLCNRHPRRRRM